VAPPEKYAHLNGVPDHLGEIPDRLDVMFCGINPGQMSATTGHHYAHRSNHFWRCLHGSGFTNRLLKPEEDGILPAEFGLGLTNIVDRPTAQAAELHASEYAAGVPSLFAKIYRHRPRVVCFVGKGIWDSFIRAVVPPPSTPPAKDKTPDVGIVSATDGEWTETKSEPGSPFDYDLQPYKVVHVAGTGSLSPLLLHDTTVRETLFFVIVSTSGLVASHQLPEKTRQFTLLKQRVDALKAGTFDTSSMAVVTV
ncbi:DNA glycosylase, partial [Epithele typhae]|uniref:DNA glycosylase n=1 Tax=Epithele typhae TaxID=378194 RepID=UPI00200894E1